MAENERENTQVETMDPGQCPFRETCPHLMQCINEFLVDMARKDWGLDDKRSDDVEGEE